MFVVKNTIVAKTSIEVNIIGHEDTRNINTANGAPVNATNLVEIKTLIPKSKHHVPKFMLELYEKNKSAKKREADADLVRSLIPAQAGELAHFSQEKVATPAILFPEKLNEGDILQQLSENHLLVFNIPSSAKDEKFMAAEIKVLTRIEIRSKEESGKVKRSEFCVRAPQFFIVKYHIFKLIDLNGRINEFSEL